MPVYKGNTIDEVVDLLDRYKGEGMVIAGGTDLIINARNQGIKINTLIDISGIKELTAVTEDKETITIGAASTFTSLAENPLFAGNLSGLAKACRAIGSPQIRNRGTIGGNIANRASSADGAPPLLCLDSVLVLQSARGKREVALHEFYKDNVPIEEDELITFIKFKKPNERQFLSFEKLALRKAQAIARLSIASLLELDDQNKVLTIKIASCALGRYPMRESETENFLLDKTLTEDVIEQSLKTLQEAMTRRLGARPTLPYKRQAVARKFKDILAEGKKRSQEVGEW